MDLNLPISCVSYVDVTTTTKHFEVLAHSISEYFLYVTFNMQYCYLIVTVIFCLNELSI